MCDDCSIRHLPGFVLQAFVASLNPFTQFVISSPPGINIFVAVIIPRGLESSQGLSHQQKRKYRTVSQKDETQHQCQWTRKQASNQPPTTVASGVILNGHLSQQYHGDCRRRCGSWFTDPNVSLKPKDRLEKMFCNNNRE